MFDLSKLGDMSKLASQAQQLQEQQQRFQQEQLAILRKISNQLDDIAAFLKDKQ